jgi:hypothetical protein
MVAVAARAKANDTLGVPEGEILAVVTAPWVPARKSVDRAAGALEPFPTTFYLTHPTYTAALSRLEADGAMKGLSDLLDPVSENFNAELAADTLEAHQTYLTLRDELSAALKLDTLSRTHPDTSAGGLPTRVKCLHALYGFHLASPYALGTLIAELL